MHEEDEVARRQVDLDKVDGAAGAARELALQIERADGLGEEGATSARSSSRRTTRTPCFGAKPPATAAATASGAERIW